MAARLLAAFALLAVSLILGTAAAAQPAPPEQPQRSSVDEVVDTPLEADEAKRHQHGGSEGHLPGSIQNVELVGQVRVHDAAPGRIADVGALGNYAYLAAFDEPECREGGVYVIDISDPRSPKEVNFIPTAEGSFVGEGVQALRLRTPFFGGDLLVHNNEICEETPDAVGGMSLWDVSDPLNPKPLALGVGDTNGGTSPRANQIHSVFVWQAGRRAFAVLVDDEEELDVDIFEITDPRNPVQIAETGLPDWPDAQQPLARGNTTFFHDVVVKEINGQWRMLVSYWDAGWVILDVNDPANPVFLGDTDYPNPDPLTGFSPPEGNAHQAEWSFTNEFFIGTDEDFNPYRLVATIGSGPFAGEQFQPGQGSNTPPVAPDSPLTGPTYFLGDACNPASVPAAPSEDAIGVIERGGCTFTVKTQNAEAAGYQAVIVFNNQTGAPPCEAEVSMGVDAGIPAVGLTPRSVGFKILGITGYDPADCPDVDGSQPPLPPVGTRGSDIDVRAAFDGWGYVHLIDANTLEEIDAYAIPEALDPAFARGFGELSVHEVATDPDTNIAYFSWYNGGFRVLGFGRGGFEELGHYIHENGNNFWGVEVWKRPRTNEKYILASDRDSGLWIFRLTTDLAVTKTDDPDPVGILRQLTYTVTVTNNGPGTTTDVRLTDDLPRAVFISATPSQGRCSGGRTVTCRLGELDRGESATVRIVVRPITLGRIVNTAKVRADEPDANPDNNTATETTLVRLRP